MVIGGGLAIISKAKQVKEGRGLLVVVSLTCQFSSLLIKS